MYEDRIRRLTEERAELLEQNRAILTADEKMSAEQEQEFDRRSERIDQIDGEAQRLTRAGEQERDAELRTEATREADEREAAGEVPAVETDRKQYRSAFDEYLRVGREQLTAEHQRDLSIGTNTAGGYTVPTLMADEMLRYMRDFGTMRSICRVVPTSGGEDLDVPKIDGFATAAWTAEAAAFNEGDGTFATDQLKAYKATNIAQVSEELIQDSKFDIEGEVARQAGEAIGVLENTAFVTGDGTGKPTGIDQTSTVGKTGTTGQTTTVIYDDLIDLVYSVLRGHRQNARFLADDTTWAAVRKLKDGNSLPIWEPSTQAGEPGRLLGYPFDHDPDVPAMAASAKSIYFGNFSRYWIRDAGGISVQRLNELYAANGQVGFRIFRRVDGKLLDPNAVKHYANSAT